MLLVKPLPIGQPLPRAIDARVLCGETVTVRVGRGGLSLFALSYAPSASAQWRSFPMGEQAELALAGRLPNSAAFGAFQDGEMIGLAVCRAAGNAWCELLDLRVDPAHRLTGVGRNLLDACQRCADGVGAVGLRCETRDDHPVMCQFLAHCGFELQGLDRLAWAMTPEERVKPMMRRCCGLIFYRTAERARGQR